MSVIVQDVIVIGAGQSGLAIGYYLRKAGLSFLVLDAEPRPGGSWPHQWPSLTLFSPAQWSSLPGILFPGGVAHYPSRDEVIAYLTAYEAKYDLPVVRPVQVRHLHAEAGAFRLSTSKGDYCARAVVCATGTFRHPLHPPWPGLSSFRGRYIHSSHYRGPHQFQGQKVAVVGEGNSGAQILAELSAVAEVLWITQKAPRFLPDHIDGRYLFDAATQQYEAARLGQLFHPPSLGDIVMVPAVRAARDEGRIPDPLPPFQEMTPAGLRWADGTERTVEAVIACTGYRPALDFLENLNLITPEGRVMTEGTRAVQMPGLWLVGYGGWTGFASATLIGVGRSARQTVAEVQAFIRDVASKNQTAGG